MPRVALDVMLKPELLDPQGRSVANAITSHGLGDVSQVRVGKHIELDLNVADDELEATVTRLCDELLVNQVIETVAWNVVESAAS